MIVECQSCGAPLEADGTQMFVVCTYCGVSNKVASSRTLARSAPGGWQPPTEWQAGQRWTPEEAERAIAAAATGTAAASVGTSGCVMAVTIGVFMVIAGGAMALIMTTRAATGPAGGLARGVLPFAPSWDGQAPLSCSMNEELRIEGVTANLPRDTAITASMNCEVTLVDSHITAYRGIDASGNGVIRLENSTIEAEEVGVELSLNKRLELVDSTVTSRGIGVSASMNADVLVQGGRVQGSPVAVETSMNAELDNRGGQLVDGP